MSAIKNYLILSATGRQGSAVLRALLTHEKISVKPSQVSIVTRNAQSGAAARLVSHYPGLNVVQGDTTDPASLLAKLPSDILSGTAVYINLPDDPVKELAEAPAFIDALRGAAVRHVVYSSVDRGLDSDNEPSWVPQFQSKYETEKHIRKVVAESNGALTYTILRPVFFMENFQWGFLGQVVATGVKDKLAGMKVQMVATRDIGRWAAEALLYPEDPQLKNKAISLASDEVTFPEADKIFLEQTGQHIPTTFSFLAGTIIYMVGNVNKLFRWFHDRPSEVDIEALSARLQPTTFQDWAASAAKKQK